MGRAHVLVIPYPAQGHVIPMMELAQCLAQNGIRVTFINTEFNHGRIMKASTHTGNDINDLINMVSIPDGLEAGEDRNDVAKLEVAMPKIMPQKVEALIEEINQTEGEYKVTCVIADYTLTWAIDLAQKMEMKRSAFLPIALALMAFSRYIPNLLDQGIIDNDGVPLKQQMIELSPEMPALSSLDFVWTRNGDLTAQKITFHSIIDHAKAEKSMDWMVCNSGYELELGASKLVSEFVPIGPLLASNRVGGSAGYFWPEDSASLSWLDQQPPDSVIYVAFGSLAILDEKQFQELALGLELTNRPFLWVVRQDLAKETDKCYPEAFEERIKNRGKIVRWAPQQKVLSHPSVACFLSHCGWNSTVEGISNGVPFLCWPCFADQFLNQGYISDYWKVGLRLDKDENGVIRGEEIKNKVELLLIDRSYKTRALNLQLKAVSSVKEGGCSQKNFSNFVNWIKENNN